MPTYVEVMEILKQKDIGQYSHYGKSTLVDVLIKRGLISVKYDISTQEKAKKNIYPKYYFQRQIRINLKKVEIHDLETDKFILYPSI